MKIRQFLSLLAMLSIYLGAKAQYTVDKVVGQRQEALRDSLEKMEYPYMLPIWGKKVVKKGFDLPYPAGLSVQYVWQSSQIIINNLKVGFNGGEMINMDQLIRVDQAKTVTSGVNIRPDLWIFPFLNVYAIFARSNTSTSVNCGLWVPDSSGWHKAVDFSTKANFKGTTAGFGLTPTFGIGGFFLALDMNFTWTDIEELDKPAYVFILGPRLGKNFKFKGERSLAAWVGGFRVHLNNGTSGSLSTSDLFPVDQWQQRIDSGYMKVSSSQDQVDAWWNGLTPPEQKNPVNIAKHNVANTALARAGEFLNSASEAVSNAGKSTVQYSLDKTPKDKWNFVIGSQFQLNKRFMVRAEYGFLGSRQQFIGGLQYRFGF
jgi:hypothetical protein